MEDPVTAGFWLSPQQKHVWTLQQSVGARRSVCLDVIEGLELVATIPRALQHVLDQHEILRTIYVRQPGMMFPFQAPLSSVTPDFESIDVSGISATEQESALNELFRAEQLRESLPDQSPILTAKLLTLGPSRVALLLGLPAMSGDSRSLRILADEVLQFATEAPSATQVEPLRYVQFSQWQNDLLDGDDENAVNGREFWARHAGLDSSLVTPNERKSAGAFSPQLVSYTVDYATRRNVQSAATALRASKAEILLAAWQSLLWRLTGQTSFSIGVVFEGREYEELQGLIGLVAKTIPIRARFDGDYRFREVAEQVHASVAEAAEWQECYPPGSGFAAEPPISFEFVPKQRISSTANPLSVSQQRVVDWHDAYKLKLSALESGENLILEFHFDESRFEPKFVERLAGYFQRLLTAAVTDPEMQVLRLPLLDEAENRQLVIDWNQTSAAYPCEKCFHELFEAQVLLTPDRPAVRFSGNVLNYRELNEKANQLAHFLRASGVHAGSLVGLCVERSAEMLVALLAILKAGGAYVPLNPDNPRPRLMHQLSGLVALITEDQLSDRVPPFAGKAICLDRDLHLWTELSRENMECTTTPESGAYVIYTSGSTGVPKGVAVRHRNLVNYSHFVTQCLRLDQYPAGLNFATVSTIAADLGNTCIFPALISGGCVHIIAYDDSTDPQRLAEYTTQYPIDVLKIVPSHLQTLLQSAHAKQILPRRVLILGGEALTSSLVEKIESFGPTCEIFNHYGPTETTVGSLTLRLADFDWKNSTAATIPIGRPIANTQVYVLDGLLQPVPTGAVGELYIAGDGVSAGYLAQPERTKERFLPNPFAADSNSKMYRTGDLARYLPSGEVEFLGRSDDQIKIRGFRIELGEIESVLLQDTGVKQAVVMAKDDGRGDKRLVAYVVTNRDITAEDIRTHLKAELPDFMAPSAIVLLPRIPLTSNGKIDRQALPEPEAVVARVFIAPKTETEVAVSKIFAEVLRRDSVSTDDNFFDLGGHSLLATQVVSRIREHFQIELPIRALFENPTIDRLAGAIANCDQPLQPANQSRIVRVSRDAYRAGRT